MKRILFVAAMAVALSSCSKNEVLTSNLDGNAIGFSNYVGTAVKGTVATATSVNAEGKEMGVFAYTNAITSDTGYDNFMSNTKLTYGTAWTYSPLKYWPTSTSAYVDFFAYYPYDGFSSSLLSGLVTTSYPTFTFTQKDALADMVDFLHATTAGATSNGTSGVVFALNHGLSRISFSAYSSADSANGVGTFITITGLSVSPTNVVKEGTFKFASTTATNSMAAKENSTTYQGSDWAIFASNATVPALKLYTGTIGGSGTGDAAAAAAITSTSPASITTAAVDGDGTAATANYLFLVPQTLDTDASVKSSLTVTITYTTETYDGTSTVTTAGNIATATVGTAEGVALAQGTAYNVALAVGPTSIAFASVTVENWFSSSETAL